MIIIYINSYSVLLNKMHNLFSLPIKSFVFNNHIVGIKNNIIYYKSVSQDKYSLEYFEFDGIFHKYIGSSNGATVIYEYISDINKLYILTKKYKSNNKYTLKLYQVNENMDDPIFEFYYNCGGISFYAHIDESNVYIIPYYSSLDDNYISDYDGDDYFSDSDNSTSTKQKLNNIWKILIFNRKTFQKRYISFDISFYKRIISDNKITHLVSRKDYLNNNILSDIYNLNNLDDIPFKKIKLHYVGFITTIMWKHNILCSYKNQICLHDIYDDTIKKLIATEKYNCCNLYLDSNRLYITKFGDKVDNIPYRTHNTVINVYNIESLINESRKQYETDLTFIFFKS